DVRSDLRRADWVSLKVDAATEKLWRIIDRPHGKLNLHQILDGMLVFRSEFKGTLVTETMLVKGMNDSVISVHEIGQFLARLQPDIVYLSIPTRPPADKNIRRADPETINIAYQIMKSYVDKVELIIGYEGNAFSFTGDIREDILNITAVHPLREDAVTEILNQSKAEWAMVNGMLQEGELIQSEFEGHIFFIRNF
ncbi:MAG: radical SAM protein, partial [Calditrichae bacterium]|nr:radical SAM protein [Calditrichia bacterium]